MDVLFSSQKLTVALLTGRLSFYVSIPLCFLVISSVCVHVCSYVLGICRTIAGVRLKVDLSGG